MKVSNFFIEDSSGKKSATATVFLIGAVVVTLKLLFSGITVGSITLDKFSGVDFGAAIGALGGIYTLRRSTSNKKEKEEE